MSSEAFLLPPARSVEACALFEAVFGVAVTPEQWTWKYHDGPRLGHLNVVVQDDEGRLVGHAGVTVFPGSDRGRPRPMAQVCDVMVARDTRGGLGPRAVYPRLMAGVREHLAARFPGVLAYGFPGARPFLLGERLGYYRRLYDCSEATLAPVPPLGWRPWRAVASDWDLARLDADWTRLGPRQPAPLVARTGAYLAWRYRDHPRRAYRLWRLAHWWRAAGWLVTAAQPDGSQCIVDALLPGPEVAGVACTALQSALASVEPSTRASGASADHAPGTSAAHASPALATWLPLPGARPTPIVAMRFLCSPGDDRDASASPAFQPGDTDVY